MWHILFWHSSAISRCISEPLRRPGYLHWDWSREWKDMSQGVRGPRKLLPPQSLERQFIQPFGKMSDWPLWCFYVFHSTSVRPEEKHLFLMKYEPQSHSDQDEWWLTSFVISLGPYPETVTGSTAHKAHVNAEVLAGEKWFPAYLHLFWQSSHAWINWKAKLRKDESVPHLPNIYLKKKIKNNPITSIVGVLDLF